MSIHAVHQRQLPRVTGSDGTCTSGAIPSGYAIDATTLPCEVKASDSVCFDQVGNAIAATGRIDTAASACVVDDCYVNCSLETDRYYTLDPASFEPKTGFDLQQHDGRKTAAIESVDVPRVRDASGVCRASDNVPAGYQDSVAGVGCAVTAQDRVCTASRTSTAAVAATGTMNAAGDTCTLDNCYDYDPLHACDYEKCDDQIVVEMNKMTTGQPPYYERPPYYDLDTAQSTFDDCGSCPRRQLKRRAGDSSIIDAYWGDLKANIYDVTRPDYLYKYVTLKRDDWARWEPTT